MVGNQFGFNYISNDNNLELFDLIKIKLEHYLSYYNLVDEDILYIQISFRKINKKIYSELKLDTKYLLNIDNIEVNDNFIKRDILNTKKLISLPVNIDKDYLGKPLDIILGDNNDISIVNININNKICNFLDIIKEKAKYLRTKHSDNITVFDKDFKFYYIKSTVDYVLVVKAIDVNTILKYRYSLSGVLITSITDFYKGNKLYRKSGSKQIEISNNKILKITEKFKFIPISKYIIKDQKFIPNRNIGVIDLETYLTDQNINKVYALGFKTNLNEKLITYYIDKNLNSDYLVTTMIDELLRPKYKDITFYCHNLGRYDIVFLLKILYNENNIDKYNISCLLRNDNIIKVTIKKGNNTLNILDSYCMLPNYLSKLGKDFKVENLKSLFPYKFSTQNNLFYKGQTPAIYFYDNLAVSEYEELVTES